MTALLANGIPGTGMPAFRSLSKAETNSIVGYLRQLQGRDPKAPLPGDPARGKTLFFGKAECGSCHMVQGEGGFLGSDLSGYGASHSADEILAATMHPRKDMPGSQAAHVVTRDGEEFRGLVRNEDNFSLQLQTADGAFHFLLRSDLQSLEYPDDPMMPSNYGERLQRSELNDLASYLMSLGRSAKTRPASQDED